VKHWKVDSTSTLTVESMICTLAGMCNGASTYDGAGFSKVDVNFGHSLAERASENRAWTEKQAHAAIKLIKKYQRQLGGAELIDNWLLSPVFKNNPVDPLVSDTTCTRKLYSKETDAEFSFDYNAELVAAIKTELKGEHKNKKFWASWNSVSKSWTVPVNETSIWHIMDLAERFEFQIEKRFIDYFERIKEKTANSRTMLSLNGNRHIVCAGDTIIISINNAAILEEFENELRTA